METVLLEWGNLLGRWLHVVAAMAWVGTSFYFMHIDAALRPSEDMPAGKGGEAWEVHGGGFYRVRKYLVAPPGLPDHLIWHKWASYSTWLSGVALLVWIYYLSADLFLIDPGKLPLSLAAAIGFGVGGILAGWVVYDLLCRSLLGRNDWALFAVLFIYVVAVAWLFQQVFTGRGALVHTGAVLATIMSGNVAMLIIPNQRKVVKALLAGDDPDPALGSSSKQRSTHNNYLTLPVVFLMLSNHYPLITDSAYAYLMVGLVLIAGAFIRHFFNERNAGRGQPWWCFAAAAVAMAGIIALSILGSPAAREQISLAPLPPQAFAAAVAPPQEVVEIVQSRCSMCHAETPAWPGIGIAPKGVRLDTPEAIGHWKREIGRLSSLTHAMPPGNLSEITAEERAVLAAWMRG